MCKKDYFWNSAKCSCKNGKYLRSIIGNSVVICDEIIEEIRPIPTGTISTKCTLTSFYISLVFLLITMTLLIAFSVYKT